jgi:hypothetical protein
VTATDDVQTYLAAVRASLADLPTAERDDLLAEVEASLVEAESESGGNIAARLGPPEEFAAELRAAAGLHQVAPAARAPSRLRPLLSRLMQGGRAEEVRRLAPIWWVARAYALVGAIALLVGAGWSEAYTVVPKFGSGALGLLAILGAMAGSVLLGLRTRMRPIVELALLAAAVPVLVHLAHPPVRSTAVYVQAAQYYVPGLAYNGVPLGNVYPFTRQGRLLHDVLLYTGAGVPIDVAGAENDPQRRVLQARNGEPVLNAFPVRYFEPGTGHVAHPGAAPRVRIPRIATPPLAVGN